MKRTGWAITLAAFAYTYLFYHQNAGINFLIFALLLSLLQGVVNRDLLKNKQWLLFTAAGMYAGATILFVNTDLSILAFCVTLCMQSLAGVTSSSSLVTRIVHAIYSGAGSIVFMSMDVKEISFQKTDENEKNAQSKLLIYFVVLVLVVIFFMLYKNINPLFENYTRQITFDFLTLSWLCFFSGGLLIVYAFMKPRVIEALRAWELTQDTPIEAGSAGSYNSNEKKGLLFLFVVLNLMLVFINILDVNYLYLAKSLPPGITHKQFVHNGVSMLLFSIVLGISVILFAFRGDLNFEKANTGVRLLVYAWLAQNMIMALSTAVRNQMYIHEALLTYKRIGVYYWLVLACAGLLATFIKIRRQRKAWYLVRVSSFFAYLLLLASACIDWDKLISDYNFSHIRYIASLDKKYLISLSETTTAKLYSIKYDPDFETDSVYHYEQGRYANRAALDAKLYAFLKHQQDKDWRSFNFRTQSVLEDIAKINRGASIDTLDLRRARVVSLSPIEHLSGIRHLKLPSFFELDKKHCQELYYFPRLESLTIPFTLHRDTSGLRFLPPRVKTVYISTLINRDSVLLKQMHLPFKLVMLSH